MILLGTQNPLAALLVPLNFLLTLLDALLVAVCCPLLSSLLLAQYLLLIVVLDALLLLELLLIVVLDALSFICAFSLQSPIILRQVLGMLRVSCIHFPWFPLKIRFR
jgi:hypothetical protein